MLNSKNNENDDVFDEICKKKKTNIKIKFQKIKNTFLDSIPRMKNLQPPLMYSTCSFESSKGHPH